MPQVGYTIYMTDQYTLYRLRSIRFLLEEPYQELLKQEIYLSTPAHLNDPMEGYQDIVWRGDRIAWTNLFRHYLLALTWCYPAYQLMVDQDFEEVPIPVWLSESDFPTDLFKQTYRAACSTFFAMPRVVALSRRFDEMPALRANTLKMLLTYSSLNAFEAVHLAQNKKTAAPFGSKLDDQASNERFEAMLDALRDATHDERPQLEDVAAYVNGRASVQKAMLMAEGESLGNKKISCLLYGFPLTYVDAISRHLLNPAWHVACFSSSCTDSTLWAMYGDQHRGAALIFKGEYDAQGNRYLPLNIANGLSLRDGIRSIDRRFVRLPIHEVIYSDTRPELNFFENISTISRGKLRSTWHENENKQASSAASQITNDEQAWQKSFWKAFHQTVTTKHTDWSKEAEYRIVLPDSLGLREEQPLAQYAFSNLDGIVFGMRTAESHIAAVRSIIERKCNAEGRKRFNFYQMGHAGGPRL